MGNRELEIAVNNLVSLTTPEQIKFGLCSSSAAHNHAKPAPCSWVREISDLYCSRSSHAHQHFKEN